jgi:phosphate/sulfate permease
MHIRLLSAGLWFITAVYAGSILHGISGMHELVGPIVGLTSAALIVADPFRRLAARRVSVAATAPVTGALQTQV